MAARDNGESGASHSSDLEVIDSPQENDPALGLERSLSCESIRTQTTYRVYKRRFFGLSQLVLLNIIVSWDWLSFSPVSKTSAEYFKTSETAINWLSTSYLFSFCVAAPFTIYTLNTAGPKAATIVASCLLLVGNWVRYGGTRAGNFGAVMLGQILIGLAQPFTLSAPTKYSDVWFSEKGRVSATAIASLANPLGGALGQLINPFWATKASDIPNMVLYISVLVSTLFHTLTSPRRLTSNSGNYRMHSILRHPLSTPKSTKRLSRLSHAHQPLHLPPTQPLPPHNHQIPPQLHQNPPNLDPKSPHSPLLDLRRPLQLLLLPPKPVPLSLRLLRNPSRDRRRRPHSRRPPLRRPLLPAHRPL